MELEVEVKIRPLPQQLPPERADELLNGEIVKFEKWFLERQRSNGNPYPSPLINIEAAIVKTYIMYLASKETL